MNNQKRLMRSRSERMIGGVCGGLGAYFAIDPTLVRIAFALLVFVGVGSPLLLYLLLWVIMPPEPYAPALTDSRAEQPVTEEKVAAPVAETTVQAPGATNGTAAVAEPAMEG